jgi:hypothetical protein
LRETVRGNCVIRIRLKEAEIRSRTPAEGARERMDVPRTSIPTRKFPKATNP